MYRYEIRTWWTLQEVLDEIDENHNYPWIMNKTFYQEFYTAFSGAPIWKDVSTAKEYIEDLWKLVFARYYGDYILYTYDDEDGEVEPTAADALDFFTRLINLIVLTYPKYSTLLTAYKAKETTLLDKIAADTTGVARYNDTPQR